MGSNFRPPGRRSKLMPYYEYRCDANGKTIEVRHGMNEQLKTWGEVVARAGQDAAGTPVESSVERLMSASVPLTGSGSEAGFGGCGSSCACVPQN
jgi:predicted nucleic acid-binding Zn ribbon protein